MKKSVKIRKIIFEILYEIYQKSINFDESYENFIQKNSFDIQDKSIVYNVVLNSIRNNPYITTILDNYLKKRTSTKVKILLLSAITQIIYLNFKNYAVTDDTVEVAKIKKLNPGLVNAVLKKIIFDIKYINTNKISKKGIPSWFIEILKKNKLNENKIIRSSKNEPSLHLVFKNKKSLENFNEHYVETTPNSAFLVNKKNIKEINNYKKGEWWVQDFSSMLPIFLSPEIKQKNILDICAAPGGKSFQALSLGANVSLNDISSKRIIKLKDNLKRLNFDNKVSNNNGLEISENKNFDVVIVDSPCSGIGTIRRNPDILFKKKPPNFYILHNLQTNLLNKAARLLNRKGILIYMVCSFFNEETKTIKNNFLKQNKNFSQLSFTLNKQNDYVRFIDSDGDIYSVPDEYKDYMIDGFYSVKFIKND